MMLITAPTRRFQLGILVVWCCQQGCQHDPHRLPEGGTCDAVWVYHSLHVHYINHQTIARADYRPLSGAPSRAAIGFVP